jgi:hypothetical protein
VGETDRAVELRMRDVNPSHPDLLPSEAMLLRFLMQKRDDYMCRGQWLEARGVGISILIVWKNLTHPDAEVPSTWMADL